MTITHDTMTCTHCGQATNPSLTGEDLTCANDNSVCTDCCFCCYEALFFEIGGLVYPAVAFGPRWNGFVTPTITREIAERMAAALSAEQGQTVMYFDEDTLVIPDLENGFPADRITPNDDQTYTLGAIGWCFGWDEGPATYDQDTDR